MTPIVTTDKAGRIVIPEKTRAAHGLYVSHGILFN